MSNCLDPDQDRRSVNPDLGPNCLQNLSADDTSRQRVGQLLILQKFNIFNLRAFFFKFQYEILVSRFFHPPLTTVKTSYKYHKMTD